MKHPRIIGWRRNGAPVYMIAGGAGEGEGSGEGSGEAGEGSGDGSGSDGEGSTDWQDHARTWEKRAKADAKRAADLEAELTKLRDEGASESEKALAKARKEAADEASKTERERWAGRIIRAEVKAAAAGTFGDGDDVVRFANPAAALRFLDLDEFEVNDDGEVDSNAVKKALTDLLKREPYLAVKPEQKFGDADQGVRDTKAEVKPGNDRLRHAYSQSK